MAQVGIYIIMRCYSSQFIIPAMGSVNNICSSGGITGNTWLPGVGTSGVYCVKTTRFSATNLALVGFPLTNAVGKKCMFTSKTSLASAFVTQQWFGISF